MTPSKPCSSAASADAMPEQMQAALDAGAHSYQTKPVHLPTLLQAIDALLHP